MREAAARFQLDVMEVPGIIAELDAEALPEYLMLGYVPAPYTMFRGIRKLPPASLMTIDRGRTEIHRYWSLSHETDDSLDDGAWSEESGGRPGGWRNSARRIAGSRSTPSPSSVSPSASAGANSWVIFERAGPISASRGRASTGTRASAGGPPGSGVGSRARS